MVPCGRNMLLADVMGALYSLSSWKESCWGPLGLLCVYCQCRCQPSHSSYIASITVSYHAETQYQFKCLYSCSDTTVFCQERKPQDVLEASMDITLLDHRHLSRGQTYCLSCKAIRTLCDSCSIAYSYMYRSTIFTFNGVHFAPTIDFPAKFDILWCIAWMENFTLVSPACWSDWG